MKNWNIQGDARVTKGGGGGFGKNINFRVKTLVYDFVFRSAELSYYVYV